MIQSITSPIFSKKVAQPVVSIEELKDCLFAIDYPNDYSGNLLKDDFRNAGHLIFPDTDIFVLMFLIRLQRFGLQLAFIDPEKVRGTSHIALVKMVPGNISYFMYPGYDVVYAPDFESVGYMECDTDAAFVLLGFILKHFRGAEEFLANEIYLDNFGEILNFINGVKVKPKRPGVDYLGLLIRYWKPLVVILTLLFMYWLFDDLKEAAISIACWIGLYLLYKTFNAIKNVSDGTTTW